MKKIPVGQTIAFGIAFLVGRFGTILRLCWIPVGLIIAVEYLTRRYVFFYGGGGQGETLDPVAVLVVIAGLFVNLLASSVIAVGLTRAAMGLSLSAGAVYFPLGAQEWRMLAASIRYLAGLFVLVLLAALVTALALLVAGFDFAQPMEAQVPNGAVFVAALISIAAFGYVFVSALRMGFLLPAIVVAEAKGLVRAHDLSKGNVWRMVAVVLAIGAPVAVLVGLAQLGVAYAAFGAEGFSGGPEAALENIEEAAAAQPLLWAVYGFVSTILAMALRHSVAAFAYMQIAGKPSAAELFD